MKRVIAVSIALLFVINLAACGQTKEDAEKYCWSCGKGIAAQSAFCEHCGAQVMNVESSKTVSSLGEETMTTDGTIVTSSTSVLDKTTVATQITTSKMTTTVTKNDSNADHTHCYTETVVEPSCTEEGYTLFICVCGDSYKSYTIPTGHTEVIDKAIPASITSTGLTEGKHCKVCGTVLVEQQVVPMLEVSPADRSTITITGTDQIYNYYIVNTKKASTYVESSTYTVKSLGKEYIQIDIAFLSELVYSSRTDYICFRCELYDANGVCVSTKSTFTAADMGKKYSISIQFTMIPPGDYTVKICDY